MKRVVSLAGGLCLGMAGAALSDPGLGIGEAGPYTHGELELEFNLSDDLTDDLLGGRIDARAGFQAAGNGLNYGVELGIDAYDIPGTPHLVGWQAVGFATGTFGTVSLGAPFAAETDYGPDTVFDRTVLNTLALTPARPTPETVLRALGEPNPGIRYDGGFGNLSVALSYHSITGGQDLSAVSGVASYEGSFFTVTSEIGYLETTATDLYTVNLAAESAIGPWGGVIEVLNIDGDDYIYTLEGRYTVNDRFAVSAGLRELDFTTGGPDTSWLVEAEYGFGNGAFISATTGRTLGNQEAAVGLGLEF